MQRFASLLILIAACTSGTGSGEASMTGTMPPVKSAAAKTFAGGDGTGMKVLGWKIELYENGPGADCLSDDTKTNSTIGIYTAQVDGSAPQALLPAGEITITTMSPPIVSGSAAANMAVTGLSDVAGIVMIDEFHLTADAKHADRIKGTVNAYGKDANGGDVAVTGSFTAPVCVEQ
jgi:hypothetical protein